MANLDVNIDPVKFRKFIIERKKSYMRVGSEPKLIMFGKSVEPMILTAHFQGTLKELVNFVVNKKTKSIHMTLAGIRIKFTDKLDEAHTMWLLEPMKEKTDVRK